MRKPLLATIAFSLLVIQASCGFAAEGFGSILLKNAFRLSPPKPEPIPVQIKMVIPKVILQGLTTLLDARHALLKIQSASSSGAIEVCCVLAEGQARDGVEVLQIEMKSCRVLLKNQGTHQLLSLE